RANNRMCLTVAMETALSLPDSKLRRLVLGLDEAQELGQLELLPRVLTNARSRGGCAYLYSQSLDGFLKEYAEHDPYKILENISTQPIFRVEGRTAKWVSDQFGDLELRRLGVEWEKAAIHTQNEPFITARALQGSELAFRPPSKETGLPGLYR